MRRRDQLYSLLCGGILALSAAFHQWDPTLAQRLRVLAFDTFQQLSPRAYDPDSPVRIVDIDEASLKARGQWPWPRTELADLIARLEKMGAVAIAFDLVLPERDRLSPDVLAEDLARDPEAAPLADVLAKRRSNDAALADAIARSGVIMGFVGAPGGSQGRPPPLVAELEVKGDDPARFVPGFPAAVTNLPVLSERAAGSGFINWIADQDQIIRKLPLLITVDGKLYPSIAVEALRLAQGISNVLVLSSGGGGELSFGTHSGVARVFIGNAVVPTDAEGQMWLHFTRSDSRRYISAQSILDGSAPESSVKGRIVLVGTSAAGLLDIRATPLDPAVPGVEAHAQGLEQMLTGRYLVRPDFAPGAEIVLTLLAGAALAFAVFRAGAASGAAIGAAAIAATLAASWIAFRHFGWLIDPVYPAATLTAVYLAGATFQRVTIERERNRIRNAFGHYMSPAQVERLAADPAQLTLGGENRRLTVLFADVRGFARRSEGLDPQGITRFVIDLFTPLSDTILAAKGTIDKFIGDAVMAFWNAPLDDPDHAVNACRAALAMLEDVAALNARWAANRDPASPPIEPVSLGIGLNTGLCCVGNFGSAQRFDYSAIGNDVNLASRFEGLTRAYGLPILVGQSTAEAAPAMATLEVDLVAVKGHEQPVRLFALVGDERKSATPEFASHRERHARLLMAYRAARFEEAAAMISELKTFAGPAYARLYDLYDLRIAEFAITPPPPGWDGRAIAQHK